MSHEPVRAGLPGSGGGMFFKAAWVLLCLVVNGCVHYQEQPLEVSQMAEALETRDLNDPELRAFLQTNLSSVASWPLKEWNFEQLSLVALFLHPKLEVARAEYASARAAEITEGARPNPTVGITPEYTVNPAAGMTPWIATFQFDIPIETAGKRGHRIKRAQQLSQAARLRLGSAAWEVRSGVRSALLDLREAVGKMDLLARQAAAGQKVAEAYETKLKEGVSTAGEAAPFRLSLARARKELADARAQVGEARARLAAAIGIPLKALPPSEALKAEFRMDTALATGEARRRALTSRADLLAALADYAAAETMLKLQVAKQYPDLHLGTGYQYDQGENKWALGITAEIPLLNRNEGFIAEAVAQRAEAASRVLELQARILSEVERALASWQGAQERRDAMTEAVRSQEARVASLRAQFEAGAIESLDLLTAETEAVSEELFSWQAKFQEMRAFGELEDAVQFPLQPEPSVEPHRPKP